MGQIFVEFVENYGTVVLANDLKGFLGRAFCSDQP